jgi:hypothetical protein
VEKPVAGVGKIKHNAAMYFAAGSEGRGNREMAKVAHLSEFL